MHQDHLGSSVASTTSAGAIAWREDFTPYGEKRLDPNTNKDDEGFTGHVDDAATGLTYMQARYYDPVIGRFLSNDPVGFLEGGVGYFNRYVYTINNPIAFVDPNGEDAVVSLRREGFHLFLVIKDTESDRVYIARGGPSEGPDISGISGGSSSNGSSSSGSSSSGSSNPSSNTGGQLVAETRTLANSSDNDSYNNPDTVTITTKTKKGDFDNVIKEATAFTDAVNEAKLDYSALTQNSNSTAATAFEVVTGEDRPEISFFDAPANDLDLCNEGVSC